MIRHPISDPSIQIKPSKKLLSYIKKNKFSSSMPQQIKDIIKANKNSIESSISSADTERQLMFNNKNHKFVTSVESLLKDCSDDFLKITSNLEDSEDTLTGPFLDIKSLKWINNEIIKQREKGERVYFHELLEGSKILLPENKVTERDPELDARCENLRNQQKNREYKAMTKNVDNTRIRHPEDTIAFHMKEMNKQLIAVFQFVLSVLAGFAFGFTGIEYIVDNLDYGFRLLLGIMCALVIALAEIYFLAIKLSDYIVPEIPASVPPARKTKLHQE